MVNLYQIDSPINREQRNNINATFADILIRFTNLKYQISILSGGEDLEEILQRIEDAISDANNTTANTQQVLDDISDALGQLATALQNSNDATQAANNAANSVQNAVSDMQNSISQLGNAESYDNAKTYQENNIVEYNGSSFIALQTTTGNTPPTLPDKRNNFWQLLAQRGIDGAGAVSTVNGIGPDVNGNVILTPQDIGSTDNAEFNELRDLIRGIGDNVKTFGAVGDGVTDDTAAIQDAIDSSSSNVVYFPPGTYRVTGTINISGNDRKIRLVGDRWLSAINIEGGNGFLIAGTNNTTIIDGFYIKQSTTTGSMITLDDGIYHQIKNCIFQRTGTSTDPIVKNYCSNTRIAGNYFVNDSADSDCITVIGKTGLMNINSMIIDNYFGGVSRGIIVTNESGAPFIEGLNITGNKFICTGAYSIQINSGLYISIDDNVIDQASQFGIVIQPYTADINHISISNNYIAAAFAPTTSVAVNMVDSNFQVNNTSLINNKIGYSGYGIIVSNKSNNNVITNNSFSNINDIGINLNNAGSTIFTGNTIQSTAVPVLLTTLKTTAYYIISQNIVSSGSQITQSATNLIRANNFGM